MNRDSMTKITVGVKEFAAMTGIGQNKIRGWCNLPDFPASMEGNRYLIHVEKANEWLQRRTHSKTGIDANILNRIV